MNKINAYQKSITGNYRKENQDAILFHQKHHGAALFVICDGMGGHPHGRFASQFTIKTLQDAFEATDFTQITALKAKRWLKVAFQKVQAGLTLFGQQNPDYADMGTVATACLKIEDNLYWVHTGDTRLYMCRDELVEQITQDQNLATSSKRVLSKISKLYNGNVNLVLGSILTSSLGPNKPLMLQRGLIKLQKNDLFYLTTDGLHDYIKADDLLVNHPCTQLKVSNTCKQLVKWAETNGSHDNISILSFFFE